MKSSIIIILLTILLLLACKSDSDSIETAIGDTLKQTAIDDGEKIYKPRLPTRVIEVAGHKLRVEVADEQHERQRGLMFRSYLPDSAGMLFIFDDTDLHPFWMKNTFIPLAIAFIDEDSIITDIKWMKPQDTNSYYPSKEIKYTIEVNRGWFVKRDIKPGMKVDL